MTDGSAASTPSPSTPPPPSTRADAARERSTDAADAPTSALPPSPEAVEAAPVVWASLNRPLGVGFALTLGGLIAILLGIAFANLSTIIIYIVFAMFAALGLDPVVRWLERHKVPRPWGIVIVFFGFAVVIAAVLLLIVPAVIDQIAQFISDIPDLIAQFQASDLYTGLQDTFGDEVATLMGEVQTFLTNPANIAAIGGGVLQVGVTIATTISGLIIVLVLSLYFLASLPTIKVSLTRLTPARNRPRVMSLTDQITDSIGGYLMGMVILAFCNSIVALILHLALGLPFAALMAVVAFAITLIPLIGSVLYWIIATSIALFSSPVAALIFALIYLIYMQLEAYVLTPRVMNRTISVPGSLVVIGALVGGTLLGLLGALVAIPVTASILLIIKQVIIPKQDAKT